MPFIQTEFSGLIVFEPTVFADSRGYFFESYSKQLFATAGINIEFVQDNESKSNYGVLRGLHYQRNPKAQAKLVRVVEGEVLDVVGRYSCKFTNVWEVFFNSIECRK
jgi:dTDP-4-dehydrorhamnose 3,5-epimerase